MNSNEWYRLFDLEFLSPEAEALIKEIVATLDNYEYLKSKLPECRCPSGESRMIIEGICSKCGGIDNDKTPPLMVWKW